MRLFVVLLCVLIAPWTLADVYKTVDKDGRVIYTDKPKSDKAEKIELREINTVPSPPPLPQSVPVDTMGVQQAAVDYRIGIISPRSDVTIPVGQRDLAIAINIEPALQPGHLLVYFMNGELLEETTGNNIIVKDVPRGTHTLVVEAIDADGRSLGTSPPVIVNVIRPNIKNNALPKPTPK
ncbi:DUF4124 domain-containing protein [Cellvibrio sp. pealriver]|uniref:DUF4124 domain-containing protein n=1 Tax=Cellvibrio sp. pealriver TaxID=1622269 RepID=UPI00066FC8CB|nr:DUF4124 domain-containing protein [Cellvibrio sp. pealriver]